MFITEVTVTATQQSVKSFDIFSAIHTLQQVFTDEMIYDLQACRFVRSILIDPGKAQVVLSTAYVLIAYAQPAVLTVAFQTQAYSTVTCVT